jgi:inner membrane protein
MPTIISHAVVALATGKTILISPDKKVLIAGMICSMLPDADVIGFRFGIAYESLWGHRGITHSFFFAFLLSMLTTFLLFYDKNTSKEIIMNSFLFLFVATALHPILDACTNGGHGVALLAPFYNERFFAPWRPINVSRFGLDAFRGAYGLQVILSELMWIWIPSLFLWLTANFLKNNKA